MLRNWKKTASQQEFHKDVHVVWQSWKRWEKSCDGYHLRLNSKRNWKKEPNDVCNWRQKKWNVENAVLTAHELTDWNRQKKSNGLCFDRRNGNSKAIKRTQWNRQKTNDLRIERISRTNRLKLTKKKPTISALNWIRNVMLNKTWNVMLKMTNQEIRNQQTELHVSNLYVLQFWDKPSETESHSFKRHW